MSENFQELYNNLKSEFENYKNDSDEINKEYESTIDLLSESVNHLKKEKEQLEQKISKLEQEQKIFKKEKDSLQSKNKDKTSDIQNLTKLNDRLSNEVKKLKDGKSLYDSKIVSLENDIEHYQNKLREYEALNEDLENQLESALEENITLQSEFETFKQMTGEQLIRKDDEIRDIKNDLISKDKYIQRMKQKNSYSTLVKTIQKSIKEGGGGLQEKRRFTLLTGGEGGLSDLLSFQKNLKDKNEKDGKKKVENNKARYSLFSNTLGSLTKLNNVKEEMKKGVTDKKDNSTVSKVKRNIKSPKNLFKNEQISEISEERLFKELEICQENSFDIIQNLEGGIQKSKIIGKEKVIVDSLQKILEKIRKRKEKLINAKKSKKNKNIKN